MKSILITGASGFLGKALCRNLLSHGFNVLAVVRSEEKCNELQQLYSSPFLNCLSMGDLTSDTNWSYALKGIDAVIHLAARVHKSDGDAPDKSGRYQQLNVSVTKKLAIAAAAAKVKRFLYISSIGVNGRLTKEQAFTEQDEPNPHNTYTASKWQAEQNLQQISNDTNLKITILRPPIVYGRGVKANFQSLLKLVKSGLPIPLANVNNQRSLIYVENLVDAIVACLRQEVAAGKTYLVSDGEVVSTPELIRQLATALGKPARLLAFPTGLMRVGAKLVGKESVVDRLVESLVVDSSKIRRELDWNPPYTLQQALQKDFG